MCACLQVERVLRQRASSVLLHPEIEEVCRSFLHLHCTTHTGPGQEIGCLQVTHCTRKSNLCIPRKGIARPQSQFHNSYVCLWAIYIFPGSVHIFGRSKIDRPTLKYINISQIYGGRNQGWKNPGFFFKPSPVGFFVFFLCFFGFLGFFWVFLGFFCSDERVFRVFFSFTNTFRCIQTLNYNHSLLINLVLLIYVSALDWVSI